MIFPEISDELLSLRTKNVAKTRKRQNKHITKQGYRYKDCERFFIEQDGFEGITYPKEIIVEVHHTNKMFIY